MEAREQHSQRKEQIFATAYRLFMSQGYENTTIQTIIREVGIAKGTFYHYFSSKEELLSELALWQFEGALGILRAIVDDESMTALQKFEKLGESMGMWKMENRELILSVSRTLFHPNNLRLRHTFNYYTKQLFGPLYATIIRQGVEEGVFRVTYPEETAEMIMLLSFGIGDELVPLVLSMEEDPDALEQLKRKLWSFERAIERLLGAEANLLQLYKPEQISAFAEGGKE
jgi:AcrR family transcriptional regulator